MNSESSESSEEDFGGNFEEISENDSDDNLSIQCLPLKRKIKEDAEKIQELEARIGDLEQQLKKAKSINNKLNKKYKKLQKLHH